MLQEFDAVFENGILRPLLPLPLTEREQVKVTVSRAQNREWLDTDFMEACAADADSTPTLAQVRAALAKIQGTMDEAIAADRGQF